MKTKYGWICDLHENMGLGPRKEKLDWMKAFSYLVKDFCIPERQ
jgi:hypothetical protein|tara:strand:+ start:129 stop:260 length:132 start_codon:yes stop_codon:yes gene_type:complete